MSGTGDEQSTEAQEHEVLPTEGMPSQAEGDEGDSNAG
jgi:hypothetical protein